VVGSFRNLHSAIRIERILTFLILQSVICNLQSAIASPPPTAYRISPTVPLVGRVSFSGNHALPAREFVIATRPGQPLSDSLLALDRQTILNVYAANGFYWTSVKTEAANPKSETRNPNPDSESRTSSLEPGVKAFVVFRISEGPRARLGEVRLAGNHLISGVRLRQLLPVRAGWLTEAGVKQNVEALLDFYGDNGFPFCSVQPESLLRRDTLVSYALAIHEGPEVRLKEVRFSGQFETRPALLRRLLALKTGIAYSETETRNRIARLATDPLLTVNDYQIRRTDNDYWLDVAIREARSNRVLGSAAYSAAEHELVGQFDLNLANLFGTRRSVLLDWQGSSGRQDFNFAYLEPWLLGTSIDARLSVRHRIRDTSFAATNLDLAGRIKVSDLLHLNLETGYELDAAGANLRSARTWWVGSGLEADSRDNLPNPTRGTYASLATRVGSRSFDTAGTQTLGRGLFDALAVIPLARRTSLALGAHLRGLFTSDTVYDYDLFELGGANSVRGYREGELKTARGAWLNVEPRYLLGQTARVYPFLDCALIQESPTAYRLSPTAYRLSPIAYHWHSAYGAGLRVGSRLGVFGLDYGIPIRTGSNPLNGKVHFSLQTEF
jgi:outer membrane protein assembly factor BamA